MLSNEELNDIKDRHPTAFSGIWKGYGKKRIFTSKAFWIALGGATLFSIFVACFVGNFSFTILSSLIDNAIQFMPILLGFNLGGYALIVGFGNTTLIKKLTTDYEEKKSMFQLTSAVFSFSVLTQAIALLITFLFWIIKLINTNISITNETIKAFWFPTNMIGLFVLSFFLFYSLLLVPQMIINVFAFGQMHHFTLYMERILEEKAAFKQREKESPG